MPTAHPVADPVGIDLLARVGASDIRTDPFPHVVVHDALPDPVADALIEQYPALERISGRTDYGGNERYDYPTARALADPVVTPLWKDFLRAQTSNEFVRRLFGLFADHLPEPLRGYAQEPSWPTSRVRNVDDEDPGDVVVDRQISVNTPVRERCTVKGPHVDRPIAVIPGLYYLRTADDTSVGGDLEIYRPAGPSDLFRFDGQHVPDDAVDLVETIPYEHNTLVLFVNSIRSLHGVSPRDVTESPRCFVNLVSQVPRPHFDLGAHQLDRERWKREHPWEQQERRASITRRVVRRAKRSNRRP